MHAVRPRGGAPAPPTAVVLGGRGFLGRNVCTALRAGGWEVTAAGRTGAPGPPGCRALRLDPLREGPETIVAALAAIAPALVVNTAGALWDAAGEDFERGNTALVAALLAAVERLPAPVRLVHLGSLYEYGTQAADRPLREDLTEHPVGPYARSKLAGTRLVTSAAASGRVDAVVLRIATAIGPWTPRQSLFGGLARQLAAAPDRVELPPLSGERDIVDSRDVADAVLAAAVAAAVPPVVNVGRGVSVPVADAVDALLRISGAESRGTAAPVVRTGGARERRDGGVGGQPLDITLARTVLGWSPVRDLPEALGALWNGIRHCADGSDPIASQRSITANGDTSHA
ncbi:NAD-dependent epimerase/dehydratase family protein [Streptacidiphilus sp. EB129]|uniref:NAD-dependent epimerase/dehydratase family protein n=1 Tax=Streptacidiphilus sp. EB129 TaxID=3156262 RepID=UPI003511445B